MTVQTGSWPDLGITQQPLFATMTITISLIRMQGMLMGIQTSLEKQLLFSFQMQRLYADTFTGLVPNAV